MAIRVGSSASEDMEGEGKKRRRRREKRRVREGGMFVSKENGKEKIGEFVGKGWNLFCGKAKEFLLWVWKSNLRTQKSKHMFIVGFKENWKKWEGNCGRVFS